MPFGINADVELSQERSARGPKCCTNCWNGMTLIGKHPRGQGLVAQSLIGLKSLRQPFVLVHRLHSFVVLRHNSDGTQRRNDGACRLLSSGRHQEKSAIAPGRWRTSTARGSRCRWGQADCIGQRRRREHHRASSVTIMACGIVHRCQWKGRQRARRLPRTARCPVWDGLGK